MGMREMRVLNHASHREGRMQKQGLRLPASRADLHRVRSAPGIDLLSYGHMQGLLVPTSTRKERAMGGDSAIARSQEDAPRGAEGDPRPVKQRCPKCRVWLVTDGTFTWCSKCAYEPANAPRIGVPLSVQDAPQSAASSEQELPPLERGDRYDKMVPRPRRSGLAFVSSSAAMPGPEGDTPRSSLVARDGITTAEDLALFFGALLSDLVDNRVTVGQAHAACAAGKQLMTLVEMQFRLTGKMP